MYAIYEHADDLHVVARLVYVKSTDSYAYSDADKTAKIDAETLIDAFKKGALVVDGDNLYKPISLLVSNGVATMIYATVDANTATTAVLAVLHSEEYDF